MPGQSWNFAASCLLRRFGLSSILKKAKVLARVRVFFFAGFPSFHSFGPKLPVGLRLESMPENCQSPLCVHACLAIEQVPFPEPH